MKLWIRYELLCESYSIGKFADEEGMLHLPVVSSPVNNEIKITYLHEIDVQTEGMTYEKTYETCFLFHQRKVKN